MSGGQRQALTLLMATMRNHPTYRMMKRDYALFGDKDPAVAKKEFDDVLSSLKSELKQAIASIKGVLAAVNRALLAENLTNV